MALKLPAAFVEKMRGLLGEDEFRPFMESYGEERLFGLRCNPLKLRPEELLQRVPFRLSPVPWAPEGFYYGEGDRPGKHPDYHAGLYYIQEPSAMAPVELLDVRPGDRVLDLCAAPGGKTTQIAGKLQGEGLVVTNDNNGDRVRALAKNVELYGIRNAMVLHETPDRLAARWPGYFHKILIDAPCSGEGMFRKEEDMARQWEKHSVEKCSAMQRDILEQAAALLAPGGRLVYSTCTFSPEENECRIAAFLRGHPDFRVVPVEPRHGFRSGRPDWCAAAEGAEAPDGPALQTAGAVRLWPQHVKGEGHFAAVLERAADAVVPARMEPDVRPQRKPEAAAQRKRGGKAVPPPAAPGLGPWQRFVQENLTGDPGGVPLYYGDHLYLCSPELPPLDGIKAVRPGWPAGTVKRERFEPSHALAMGLKREEVQRSLPLEGEDLIRYLKGETLFVEEDGILREPGVPARGYVLVCAGPYPVGWGKWADGTLKNEYPPGWRWI